jgi:hypothetical protein
MDVLSRRGSFVTMIENARNGITITSRRPTVGTPRPD